MSRRVLIEAISPGSGRASARQRVAVRLHVAESRIAIRSAIGRAQQGFDLHRAIRIVFAVHGSDFHADRETHWFGGC